MTLSRSGHQKVHPLSVGRVVSAEEAVMRRERAVGFGARLRQILTTDLLHWLKTLKDRRFYRGAREMEFRLIDDYFRDRGFQFSRGMSLKPSRRVLARFPALAGIFHPMEKIYVVAPGDPIFQRNDDSGNSVSDGTRSRPSNTAGGYQPDPVSTLGRIRPPRLIITSQRILEFSDDHWISHFYSDMLDELPSILSWSESYGWRRALDNDDAGYYRRVRYVSVTRKRLTINCTDTNSAGLVSWLILRVCEQNESARRRRTFFPFPSARKYLDRDVRSEHLEMLSVLGEPETSELQQTPFQRTTPPPASERRRRAASG